MKTWKGIVTVTVFVAAVLAGYLHRGSFLPPVRAEEPAKVAPENSAGSPDKRWSVRRREYKEVRWFFDIINGNVRFSHGNHKSRDRWFRAYFRKGYECGICHNTSIPVVGGGGVVLSEGEPLETVEDIRDFADEIYPYGVTMLTCLGNCHNNFTAPQECAWCHLPGSKPITEGMTKVEKW